VVITNLPKDDRLTVLKRSMRTAGFSSNYFYAASMDNFTWTKRLQIEQQIVQDAAEEDPEAILLFLDAFDVITLGGPDEVLAKFRATGKDALFSCVTYPYPHQCDGFDWSKDGTCNKASHWGAECPHWCRFACAGAFMGKAGALAQMFAENPVDNAPDDQCYFNLVMATKRYNIALDHRHEVFFSTTDLLQCSLERKGGRLVVTNTGTTPSIIHFDASHPTAAHLQSFWVDAIAGADGAVCASNSSCTDWCWDWDFGDMVNRMTASDKQLFRRVLNWVPGERTVVQQAFIGFGAALALAAAVLLGAVLYFRYTSEESASSVVQGACASVRNPTKTTSKGLAFEA